MRLFRSVGLAGLMALSSAGAFAADAITVPVETGNATVPVADPGFDWNGFYAGVFGALRAGEGEDAQVGLGLAAGVNTQLDFFLVGAEVTLQGLTGGDIDTAYGELVGRAGVVLTDDVLLYGAAGYGLELTGAGEGDALLGGGVEVAVSDDLSLDAQYLHAFPLGAQQAEEQVTFGAKFHF